MNLRNRTEIRGYGETWTTTPKDQTQGARRIQKQIRNPYGKPSKATLIVTWALTLPGLLIIDAFSWINKKIVNRRAK